MVIRTILTVSFILLYYSSIAGDFELKRIFEFRVFAENTFQPIDAQITIYHNSDFEIYKASSTVNGLLRDSTEKHGMFLVTVNAENFFQYADTIWITEGSEQLIHRRYPLKAMNAGHTFAFTDVKFYFNSSSLKESSTSTLDSIANFLRLNSSLVVEVSGHTDDEGPSDYNLQLSQGRAEAIVNFMVNKGIDKTRLIPKGYGESKPIDTGITKQAKARNRRVELTILRISLPNAL